MSTARKKKHSRSHISTKAGLARKEFQEALHRRGPGGKFADKPGAGNDAPKKGRRQAQLQPRAPEDSSGGSSSSGGVKTKVMSAKSTLNIAVSGNPKRGSAAKRFALYKEGMTIQDYVDAVGDKKQALRDLAWDMKQGWIKSPDMGTIVVRAPAKKVGGEKAKYKPGSDNYKSKNTAPVSKSARLTEDHQIYLEVGSNPKRAGAAKRFDLYKDGMTVRDYIDAVGDKRQALKDLAWDTKQGFVSAKGPGSTVKKTDVKADTGTTGAGDSVTKPPEAKRTDVKPPEANRTDVKPPEAKRTDVKPPEAKRTEPPKRPDAVVLAEKISTRSLTENKLLNNQQIDTMRRSVLDHLDEVYRTNKDSPEIARLAKLHQDLGDLRSNLNRQRRQDAENRKEAKLAADREAAESLARREAASRSQAKLGGAYRDTKLYVAKNGMTAHIGNDVSEEFVADTMSQLDKIPKHAAALLKKEGLTTHIGKNVTETPIFRASGNKATDRPRGYGEGSDFLNCGGFYNPRSKTIAVGEEFKYTGRAEFSKNKYGAHTMLHEAGHAYDYAAGGRYGAVSDTPLFREAYDADVKELRSRSDWSDVSSRQHYFLQSGNAGASETFAEGFFEVTNSGSGSAKGQRIHDHFPRSAALIRKILDAGEKAYG